MSDSIDNPIKYKKNITAMFIGHIDAGKSTLIGQILIQMDMIPQQIIDSYKKLSKENKKESWYLSYLMDTEDAERERGKTFEMNRIAIEMPYKNINETRIVTLMDTPGHTGYITEMLHAAKSADMALLIVSCSKQEFEAGIKGTTKEHLLLANNMNIDTLVIVLNKIDQADTQRINFIENKIKRLASMLFKNIHIVKVSAQENINIKMNDQSSNIEEDLDNLNLNDNNKSLLDVLASVKIPEKPYFMASSLFSTKHFSEIFVNSGEFEISNKLILSSEPKKILLNEAKTDSEETTNKLECGLFYKIKPYKGLFYTEDLLKYEKNLLKGTDLLIEFKLFSKNILITKGYNCILHLDSFETEIKVLDIIKENVSNKKKKKILFVEKETKKDCIILLRVSCKEEIVSFKDRKCALREKEFTVGVGILRNLR